MTEINHVSGLIVDCAYKIHKDLGPGLLESVYRIIMTEKLRTTGLLVEPEKPISFEYDGIHISNGFRLDLLVEKLVIVELKSVEIMSMVYTKQLLTYLKIMNLSVGLLINFGAPTMKQGVQRIINGYDNKL